jgi:hypothetical protein
LFQNLKFDLKRVNFVCRYASDVLRDLRASGEGGDGGLGWDADEAEASVKMGALACHR